MTSADSTDRINCDSVYSAGCNIYIYTYFFQSLDRKKKNDIKTKTYFN